MRAFRWILLFLTFSLGGLAVGFATGIAFNWLSKEGLFTTWEKLDGLPKFTGILDASSYQVWAQADDSKIYGWDFNCSEKCKVWKETSSIPAILHEDGEAPMEKGDKCASSGFELRRSPPGNIRECASVSYENPEFGHISYYALTTDGSIWTWQYSSSAMQDILAAVLFSIGGIILGIIAFLVYSMGRTRRWAAGALAVGRSETIP